MSKIMDLSFDNETAEKPRPRKQLRISSETAPCTPASPPSLTPILAPTPPENGASSIATPNSGAKSVTFAQQISLEKSKKDVKSVRRFHHSESEACIGLIAGQDRSPLADNIAKPTVIDDERESYSDDEPISIEMRSKSGRGLMDVDPNDGDLPPEVEEGNIEYKLKLLNPTASRLAHLTTQLKWRLREGGGEALYELGVQDNGVCVGLNETELEQSLNTLRMMAENLGATLMIVSKKQISVPPSGTPLHVCEILLRKVPDNQQFLDLRVAVLGCADAGKSTLLGVLTQPVNYAHNSIEEICEKSTKLVTFIDLAGHQKYLRTTIFGLTGYKPHCALLCVAANMGVAGTSREHLGLALALDLPVLVALTKVDTVNQNTLDKVLYSVESLLQGPGCKKTVIRVQNADDAVLAASQFHKTPTVPLFMISAVG